MDDFFIKSILFDIYGGLLSDKKRLAFEYHILDDLSFQEISEEMGLTRQACHELYKKASEELYEYDSKLHLSDKFMKIDEIVDKIEGSKDITDCKKLSIELKNIINEKRRKA